VSLSGKRKTMCTLCGVVSPGLQHILSVVSFPAYIASNVRVTVNDELIWNLRGESGETMKTLNL
jgi:hypothetical protein